MSIPSNKNKNNNNSHHKHYAKLPELKIKDKNEFNEYSPIRRNRNQSIFNSPDETHLKNNSILKKNTFNPNISNLKTNNELFISTDRELEPNIKKTKSILKKNSLNNDEIEHEHKSVHFAFDENNQPLKTVFVINNKDKVYIHKNEKNGKDDNEIKGNIKNNEICKCESCILF